MSTLQNRFSSEDRRRQILRLATEMFAEKGFDGTTTREIAARAQVNEALIFRHFATKEELYWAVLEDKVRSEQCHQRLQELLAAASDIREALTSVAEWMLRRRDEDHTSTRLALFCALERHELSKRFFGEFVATYFEVLADYMREQMRIGVLRKTNALMAARTFIGTVVYHSLVKELFGSVDTAGNMDVTEASKLMVSIWLDGMLAQPVPPRASRQRTRAQATELQEPKQ